MLLSYKLKSVGFQNPFWKDLPNYARLLTKNYFCDSNQGLRSFVFLNAILTKFVMKIQSMLIQQFVENQSQHVTSWVDILFLSELIQLSEAVRCYWNECGSLHDKWAIFTFHLNCFYNLGELGIILWLKLLQDFNSAPNECCWDLKGDSVCAGWKPLFWCFTFFYL